jgi:dihydrolipoamide dehydrogenase
MRVRRIPTTHTHDGCFQVPEAFFLNDGGELAAEATEAQLMETVFPHPTLSEMMHEAVLDAYGRALHV